MLQFDDILLLFVELNHQPVEKHPLYCSHDLCKNKNKTRAWEPIGLKFRTLLVQDLQKYVGAGPRVIPP